MEENLDDQGLPGHDGPVFRYGRPMSSSRASDSTDPVSTWAAAWVLLAIAYGAAPTGTTLTALIAAADYINHAIPTHDELSTSLVRLHEAGSIERAGRVYRLTAAAAAAIARVQTPRSTALTELRRLQAYLETLDRGASLLHQRRLRRDVYDRAVAAYLGSCPSIPLAPLRGKRRGASARRRRVAFSLEGSGVATVA